MARPKILRDQALAKVSVSMEPARWKAAAAILTSAQSMMTSAVHVHAAQRIIDDICAQADVSVNPVKPQESHE